MKIFNHIHKSLPFGLKSWGLLLVLTLGFSMYAQAQLVIGGNVYGGGDLADVDGSTEVQVISGDIEGSLYGGARMADVKGSTLVNIDGTATAPEGKEFVQNYILIDRVYGGNDISGNIGSMSAIGDNARFNALTSAQGLLSDAANDGVDATWNAFVHISDGGSTEGRSNKPIYIGQLYGGGNGDYDYKTTTSPYYGKHSPELDRTYVDIHGGSIVYAYGGGNAATVSKQTIICVDNPSSVVNSIVDTGLLADDINSTIDQENGELLTDARFKDQMGINTGFSNPSSEDFQIGRLFGGNNKAEMAIRPTWHLERGKIRNLYSGGNQGIMTSPEGLLLVIEPSVSDNLVIDNVFGGCRMADVRPLQFNSDGTHVIRKGNVVDADVIQLVSENYDFPAGLSARVLVKGGNINNVYGGNDVTGQVYGGNAVGIHSSIRGNVYGGGNGSYPYTDNQAFRGHNIYGDLYYSVPQGKSSVMAMRDYRPDAEQVSIHLVGTENNPTVIGGSVYLGGNSATLDRPVGKTASGNPLIELKVGSYVIADKVFMGNNGENMVQEDILKLYSGKVDPTTGALSTAENAIPFTDNSLGLDLTDAGQFAAYMEGAALKYIPTVAFDTQDNNTLYSYQPYTAKFGSFYCGGNVGSMIYAGTNTMDLTAPVVIYDKFVGGCNNANVPKTQYNAYYEGGILGAANETSYTANRLVLNFNGPKIEPRRLETDQQGNSRLVWNTIKNVFDENDNTIPVDSVSPWAPSSKKETDLLRRLQGGNVYGGCYSSGHINGNVVININSDLIVRDKVFADTKEDNSGDLVIDDQDGNRNSGVILDEQAFDVMAISMTVFGGGYGKNTEIWGSTTINMNEGYALQAFGGGYAGVIGKGTDAEDEGATVWTDVTDQDDNVIGQIPQKEYAYNALYSTTVNLSGRNAGYSEDESGLALPEAEYLYGAGNEGDVCGDAIVNLGNGRIYDAFGGASNALVLGHTEVHIGRQPDPNGIGYALGFPWIRDIVYGGNDFGGNILGTANYASRVSSFAKTKVHGYDASTQNAPVLTANAYVEYLQGHVDTIFGGSYGNYDYSDTETYGNVTMPKTATTFVNIRPENHPGNLITGIFGGSTGFPGNRAGDSTQNRSYVLIDIPQDADNFRTTQIFGAGSYNGLGMKDTYAQTIAQDYDLDNASAIIDLVRGKVGVAYGASFNQGVTRRSVINVPQGSTIDIGSIFGGGYGTDVLSPCDVYESHINYNSSDALLFSNTTISPILKGTIYGGNNNMRRTVFSEVNINAEVKQKRWGWDSNSGSYKYFDGNGTVYGAGFGPQTWANYTEVNLNNGAKVYEVYGGGQNGTVINNETTIKRMTDPALKYLDKPDDISAEDWDAYWVNAWKLSSNGYDPETVNGLATNPATSIEIDPSTNQPYNSLVRKAELDDRANPTYTYNTNVIINEGATVANYAYGGGYGTGAVVSGTTYIALLGGTVNKDIYAAGTSGAIEDTHGAKTFTASATAYIKGGQARNVYGGGWRGSVGHADYIKGSEIYNNNGEVIYQMTPNFYANGAYTDILGETHVIIGDVNGTSHTNGIPSITRNVYGGGEGGCVYGTAYLTINNGYIGYRYKNTGTEQSPNWEYVEELTDVTTNDLEEHGGNAFGGGYVGNSYVDVTRVRMYGGTIRGDLFGGGEIAPVGRGTLKSNAQLLGNHYITNGDAKIFKAGETHIEMYNGWVKRSVFGGGRGYDNWKGEGYMTAGEKATMDLSSKGYVFGQTDVNIYGGEIGTEKGVTLGHGNVFGGGDEGFVFSAYMQGNSLYAGHKSGTRLLDADDGYYYKWNGNDYIDNNGQSTDNKVMTEDCHVLIEPWLQVTAAAGISFDADGDGTDELYNQGSYIPTSYLNTLPKKQKVNGEWQWTGDWNKVDAGSVDNNGNVLSERGVKIHNAVFAGGNISSGSTMHASINTVFGNATASINDVYHRDLITIGTGHTGGLYGDGNLTFVDGYREINITNYGTDYYNIDPEITIDIYNNKLSPREQAYYELRYRCVKDCVDKEGTQYRDDAGGTRKASTITADQLTTLFVQYNGDSGQYESVKDGSNAILVQNEKGEWVPNTTVTYWEENGVCSRYAGRIMNTIQRADFCGVFGSRMVMQGAQDRVPETVDYTNYTINRVREVSLNKQESVIEGDYAKYTTGEHQGEYIDENAHSHGNYFGIYNVVNYLGALTSDVDFGGEGNQGGNKGDIRESDHKDHDTYRADIKMKVGENEGQPIYETYAYGSENATYYNWKKAHYKDNTRNNGNSYNQVALASGVYLELVTEKSTGAEFDQKDWGIITGVVELDLINVATGIGGGFVYARNEHGERTKNTSNKQITLSALNANAISNKMFTYSTNDANKHEWQSSGNFVHSTQTIIDDCYNIGGRYLSTNFVPAHYWFIKGQVYVYDQYISAFTGSNNAYSEIEDLPLTITTAAHGEIKLVDVKTNYYALYANTGASKKKLEPGQKLVINDISYYLNDPINYWDYSLLSASEKELFEPVTYTNCVAVKINNSDLYPAGTYVMTQSEYDALASSNKYYDAHDEEIKDNQKQIAGKDYIFRLSNNMSHNKGYILTYQVNNPGKWDQWYTRSDRTENIDSLISSAAYLDLTSGNKNKYIDGPTYTPKSNGIFGQRNYKLSDIIDQETKDTYDNAVNKLSNVPTEQAVFQDAYIVTVESVTAYYKDPENPSNTTERHLQQGVKLALSEYTENLLTAGKAARAYICTGTIKLPDNTYVLANQLYTLDQKTAFMDQAKTSIVNHLTGKQGFTESRINEIRDAQELNLTNQEKAALGEDDVNILKSLIQTRDDITNNIVPAYYCTTPGLYGGDYFDTEHNYRAQKAWSSLSESDRSNFRFNYDALDLLTDPSFNSAGHIYRYDGKSSETDVNPDLAGYSLGRSLDYKAEYTGSYTDENGSQHNNTSLSYYIVGQNDPVTINQNDLLDPADYEAIPNEKRYYSRFTVTQANKVTNEDKYRVYVVNTTFVDRDAPFAAGQTISIDDYNKLSPQDQNKVSVFEFSESEFNSLGNDNAFYFCREAYTVGKKGDTQYRDVHSTVTAALASQGISSNGDAVTIAANATRITNQEVPVGFVISASDYSDLINQQLGFSIHGVAPMEYTTLYVSRNSDIYDLSKERIITAIFQYDYDESNESGSNITPMSERHVVNIHIQFKSGIPTVGEITKPTTVLPGSSMILAEPTVTPGAYEVLGSGWELFEKEGYAENHTNGKEYIPLNDELYWYQDGYYLAYYTKTYLGKTYSNHVPVSVANYHDLKKVMDDKAHHMYVDSKRDDQRESKVYINSYSGAKNGLQLLKDFYNLSVDGTLDDHAPLNASVSGGNNLQFILRTDIRNTDSNWTPIGQGKDVCFSGTLHGDGYTISGLPQSLFASLCGNIYNLGVTGTFTGAGIAESGSGYVENSWISTTSTAAKTSKPIIGTTTRTANNYEGGLIQIVNCYYMEADDAVNKYALHDGTNGVAIRKDAQAFYNGEVAYNLNGFYLSKRHDNTVTGYVESRYQDGDFRYAAEIVPTWTDEREQTDQNGVTTYVPIWPNDYIYFGQRLTYGYNLTDAHQDNPSRFNGSSNRVYRAPAYYGDSNMGVAHFNTDAVLPATASNNPTKLAYPGMTAIDFTGYNDNATTDGTSQSSYYYPVLDFNGLTGLRTDGQTQNLLAYIDATDAATTTVITNYFSEPDYYKYANKPAAYNEPNAYSSIRKVSNEDMVNMHGHLVTMTEVDNQAVYQAASDQFLVDMQDYNAPISYAMGDGHIMWYQRTPDVFVQDAGTGWEGISLPFTAKTVTTSQKGWITHFYEGSNVGHEYWLRTPDKIDDTDNSKILFKAIAKVTDTEATAGIKGADIIYNNTFLWDYYYNNKNNGNGNGRKDKNGDTYQQYYSPDNDITHDNYPFGQAAQPYLIGFPGSRYYEFDMSGTFTATTAAANTPVQLDKQIITFVSAEGVEIGVSDLDYETEATVQGYKFKPTYQAHQQMDGQTTWIMDAAGTKFQNTESGTVATAPFRPYFIASATGSQRRTGTRAGAGTTALLIGYAGDEMPLDDIFVDRGLTIYSQEMSIWVESTLETPATVTVTTVGGSALGKFNIMPGTRIRIPVNNRGIYIVNSRKVAVTK